jgi:hypothetical protein
MVRPRSRRDIVEPGTARDVVLGDPRKYRDARAIE